MRAATELVNVTPPESVAELYVLYQMDDAIWLLRTAVVPICVHPLGAEWVGAEVRWLKKASMNWPFVVAHGMSARELALELEACVPHTYPGVPDEIVTLTFDVLSAEFESVQPLGTVTVEVDEPVPTVVGVVVNVIVAVEPELSDTLERLTELPDPLDVPQLPEPAVIPQDQVVPAKIAGSAADQLAPVALAPVFDIVIVIVVDEPVE